MYCFRSSSSPPRRSPESLWSSSSRLEASAFFGRREVERGRLRTERATSVRSLSSSSSNACWREADADEKEEEKEEEVRLDSVLANLCSKDDLEE